LEPDAMRVVVVDDSKIVRERLIKMLTDIPSLVIVGEAGNSFEALYIIEEKNPDVVILDIKIPGDSGVEVLKRVKKMNSSIVIILLTNYPSEQYKKKCIEYGADYFFDKSEEYSKVKEVMESLVERRNN
jgi:DNA-binding NarL/FixJ family response regulator